jgi:hypothetical protein
MDICIRSLLDRALSDPEVQTELERAAATIVPHLVAAFKAIAPVK